MQLRRYSFIAILTITCYSNSRAQTGRISQLKDHITRAAYPVQRLEAIFSLCRETESLHTDTLYAYTLAAKKIAQATNNFPALREAGYFETYSLYRKNKLDSIPLVMNEHLPKLKQESPGSPVIVLFELLSGRYLVRKQQYKEALGLYYHILTDAEKKKDTLNQMKAMAGIGSALSRTGDHQGALSWFLKGLQLSQRPVYRDKTIYLYTNAAVMFTRLDKPDSAARYVKQGIEYARAAENLGDLGNALGMYAGLLMDTNAEAQDLKKYAEAEKQLREALVVAEKIGDPNDIISNMGSLGMFYYNISQSEKGIAICEQALTMIRKYKLPNKLPFIYDILARNYDAVGKYKEQAATLQLLADSKDSVYVQNSAEAMSELKTRYEVQKKENTIIRQQLDLVKKDNFIYSSVLLFLLAAVTAFFVFRSYKRRQRHKAEQAIASAEESERKRIAADLHDNLGAYAASIASNVNRLSFAGDNSNDAAALKEVQNNSNAIVADLSDTIWALKKESLPLTSVSDRLKVFIQRVQPGYPDVAIDVYEAIETDHALSPSQGFHLFQTMQEAINNALKHSRCTQVVVKVEGMEKYWQVSISDNGIGMQYKQENSGGGNGLFNMQSRSEEAGWTIEWTGNEPQGTLVIIRQLID